MRMMQTARIISTYTADVSGVPSALFELGGMVIMHDASGCNSTYNTHDEPRWYDFDSMVYISGLSEMEAIMGDDEKLINDIVRDASELSPNFIALCGTPIPMMIGTDFDAVCAVIEKRTGIPAIPVKTNGMNTYIKGASMAFLGLAKRFLTACGKTENLSCNILGVTPLDFSVNTSVESMKNVLSENGIELTSCWAMGDSLDNIKRSAGASVNLVVSASGMEVARYMKNTFGIPYVIARPTGDCLTKKIIEDLKQSALDSIDRTSYRTDNDCSDAQVVVIGEGVASESLAYEIREKLGLKCRIVCATDNMGIQLSKGSVVARDEDELLPLLKNARVIIADPLYKPICPEGVGFVALPHEGFSGRIFRKDIPDTVKSVAPLIEQIERNL